MIFIVVLIKYNRVSNHLMNSEDHIDDHITYVDPIQSVSLDMTHKIDMTTKTGQISRYITRFFLPKEGVRHLMPITPAQFSFQY